mmetsp:Transcript_10021/g.14973  ORF Transcript_10021/g.14973 Transcript_10021/m.14973 type:complete len:229 (-) Transcript_10021:85-771(-)
MGCCNSRESQSKVESILVQEEAILGFRSKTSQNIDSSLYRFSSKNTLTERQLKAAMEDLELSTEFLGDLSSSLNLFFQNFKTEIGYSYFSLSCLGILLSQDPPHLKAKALFKVYDKKCTGYLGPLELKKMQLNIYNVSTVWLLGLVKAKWETYKWKLRSYERKLLEAKDCVEEYFLLVLGSSGKISEAEFVHAFSDSTLKKFLTPSSFRGFCLEMNLGKTQLFKNPNT